MPNPNCKRTDCPTCGQTTTTDPAADPVVETRPADESGVETR